MTTDTTRHLGRVPAEFRYWDRIDDPWVQRARKAWRTVFRFDPQPPDELVHAFGEAYYAADPVAEAFVDEAAAEFRCTHRASGRPNAREGIGHRGHLVGLMRWVRTTACPARSPPGRRARSSPPHVHHAP